MSTWAWPLENSLPIFPDSPGQFGFQRKFDVHTGVDLYCELDTKVIACEDGIVVSIHWFTGQNALNLDGIPSNWWNDTKAVLIEGESGVIVYGEVGAETVAVAVGDSVKKGQFIGLVNIPVLKSFKGRPNVMLHLELLSSGQRESPWWTDSRPIGLKDPMPYLREIYPDAPTFMLEQYDGVRFSDPRSPRKESEWWKIWGGEP